MKAEMRLGVVVLLLSGLVACKTSAPDDTADTVDKLEAKLSEELGAAVSVHCPTLVSGQHEYCTAEVVDAEDVVFPVRVRPLGDDLDYTTKRWVTGSRMVELGRHALKEKLGIVVDSIDCPMISHMPDGTTVRCKAQSEGVEIPVEVGIVMKVRKLTFQPVGGVVFATDAVRIAHERLPDKGHPAEVTCPFKVLVSVPGKRFECKAVMPDESESTIHYLIGSSDGALELGTEPPKGDGED